MTEDEKETYDPNPNCVLFGNILYFLAETGKKEAVDAVFYLATQLPNNELRAISGGIEHTLFKPEFKLATKYQITINKKIDEMITSKNLNIKERGKKLATSQQHIQYYM